LGAERDVQKNTFPPLTTSVRRMSVSSAYPDKWPFGAYAIFPTSTYSPFRYTSKQSMNYSQD